MTAIEVTALRADELELELACGPGFYVRALARDLAERLGTLGHLSALRRTESGGYGLERAVSFEQLRAARDDAAARAALRGNVIGLSEACRALPHLVLDPGDVEHARHGRAIARPESQETSAELQLALDGTGAPVALLAPAGEKLRVVRGFRLL